MDQESKQLLLKDLCARIPYGVKAKVNGKTVTINYATCWVYLMGIEEGTLQVIPFLRTMDSMTRSEKEFVNGLITNKDSVFLSPVPLFAVNEDDIDTLIDFCHEHHLDWRGLIRERIAVEAPEGMYKLD